MPRLALTWRSIAALAVLSLASPAGAEPPLTKQEFGTYLKGLPTATTPLGQTDLVPVLQNGKMRAVPGSGIGASPPSSPVLPTSCASLPDGSLYNNHGVPSICAPVSTEFLTEDDGSTTLTADDGVTPLGAL